MLYLGKKSEDNLFLKRKVLMKKTRVVALAFVLLIAVLLSQVSALNLDTAESLEQASVEKFVTGFMKKRAYNEWMYETNDLGAYLVDTVPMQNFLKTIELYRMWRLENKIFRLNFNIEYTFMEYKKTENGYWVYLNERLSYIIDDGLNEQTVTNEEYGISLTETKDGYIISA